MYGYLRVAMAKPLIQKLNEVARGSLSDEYLVMAHTVELSLISAGAEP